ncbi:MAG: serine/threonine protein kinase [Anaerolineae bacterium]|nr:serine/threonine protein kinase [Anaerolineae bacterium]
MSASLVGQKLGKFEITELLGQGGMATVYKGYQREVDRYVAIKVLPPHPGLNTQFVERFRLEARTIARLQHPHILPLYDYGDEGGILYLAMAYADGGSLSDRIRHGALPHSEVLRLFQQISGALDYAHRQNVIHRDIKPDNILLDREGHALLADFGIAKLMQDVGGITLTGTGGLVGTPAYMSPEQAQGLLVDNRSDIYSLGIVIFEMLTGKQPFAAETPMQLVFEHISSPVPRLIEFNASAPPDLDAVMQRALGKKPEQRYATAKDFFDDFSAVMLGSPSLSVTKTLPPMPSEHEPLITFTPTQSSAQQQTPPPPVPPTTTIVTAPAWNPLVLLGGFAIFALLAVALAVLVLNNSSRPAPVEPTAAPTTAPTVVAAQPTAPLPTAVPSIGTVSYLTDTYPGDVANLAVRGLTLPPQGQTDVAWLHNVDKDTWLRLGDLRLDPLGNGQLSLHGDPMLPALYNSILITQEGGETDAPTGRTVYSGTVPDTVMDALREILIASPGGIPGMTGDIPFVDNAAGTEEPTNNSSLLAGVLAEAKIAAQHSGLAAQATSAGSMHTHAEHTINILNGTQVDYNSNGRGENPGRGFGVPYFTNRIQAKLDAIASAPTSNSAVESQIELVRVCLVNVQGWLNQVVALETLFLQTEDIATVQAQLAESTQLADAIINGVDLNGNGQVEPFEGECGLQQISEYGISLGNLNLFAGALPQGE